MANPLKRAAQRIRNATGRIQRLMGSQPAYATESEQSGIRFEPKNGREAPRWTAGDDNERPNAKDLYYLYNIAGRHRLGVAVIVTGITEGDYPGHEGEPYVTLGARINSRRFHNALENPNNHTARDIVNQIFLGAHGVTWTAVYEVSIIYEGA